MDSKTDEPMPQHHGQKLASEEEGGGSSSRRAAPRVLVGVARAIAYTSSFVGKDVRADRGARSYARARSLRRQPQRSKIKFITIN